MMADEMIGVASSDLEDREALATGVKYQSRPSMSTTV